MKILVSEKLSQHKYKTPEGYLICTDAILARTGKQTYTKDELFGDGDSSDIEVDRPYEQVMNEKTIASFENKPVTFDHPDEDVNVSNYKSYAVGYVRDVHQGKVDGADVLLGNLVVTDQDAINAIEEGDHCELSCGYDCDIKDDGNGNYSQNNIRGNHVALCKQGRAGNAKIIDSIKGEDNMTKDSIKLNFKNFSELDRYAPVEATDDIVLYKHMVKNGLQQYYFVYNDDSRSLVEHTKRALSSKYFRSVNTIHADFETPDGDKFTEAIVVVKNSDVKDSIKDKLDRQLEVYRLCKENNWFTMGNTEDYEYMLDHCDVWHTEKIAYDIANHSKQSYSEIYAKLKTRLGDSVKDSKFYVGISKYDYTKEQAEKDARKYGLKLEIKGKSRDPHSEYDAYLIGPRANIMKMLKATGNEDFAEDIEDSVEDSMSDQVVWHDSVVDEFNELKSFIKAVPFNKDFKLTEKSDGLFFEADDRTGYIKNAEHPDSATVVIKTHPRLKGIKNIKEFLKDSMSVSDALKLVDMIKKLPVKDSDDSNDIKKELEFNGVKVLKVYYDNFLDVYKIECASSKDADLAEKLIKRDDGKTERINSTKLRMYRS